MKISRERILRLFGNREQTIPFRDMMRMFGIGKGDRRVLKEVVDGLVDEGKLQKLKGNVYRRAPEQAAVVGRLSVHPDGYGFFAPEAGGEEIFIPARHLRENMHGDTVELRIVSGRAGKKEGRIVSTLDRGYDRIIGIFRRAGNFAFVTPHDSRITRDLHVTRGAAADARDGQVVVAAISTYPAEGRPAVGKVVEVIGWPEDPGMDVEILLRKYALPVAFSRKAADMAARVRQEADPEEILRRTDLRQLVTVTIDGETARDFDDAVSAKAEGENIRLWVSIADVSHYVPAGSAIDDEAIARGTSVYFPNRCIPMLPEELSNGICSLNPHVDRLTVTAEMLFDSGGHRLAAEFYPSVIRSTARLTYSVVRDILERRESEQGNASGHLEPDLRVMQELAARLNRVRRERGSIDFDLPEPEIVIDLQGETEAILRAERNVAHRLIEEFMLAANEAVASFLEAADVPSLYRVHEVPDPVKIADLVEVIAGFGYELPVQGDRIRPEQVQNLLERVAGSPEEKLVNTLLLRAMKQARYSEENLGHFGLAASCYTHFTSPIRRYPDLVVHRILKEKLAGKLKQPRKEQLAVLLPEIALRSSQRERTAMEAEREMVQLMKARFMAKKVGEVFAGHISGITQHGFHVELTEYFVEGFVHVSTLPHDYYRYLERSHSLLGKMSGTEFRMGTPVTVLLAKVDLEKRQIDFVLSDEEKVGLETAPPEEEYRKIPVRGKKVQFKGQKRNVRGRTKR